MSTLLLPRHPLLHPSPNRLPLQFRVSIPLQCSPLLHLLHPSFTSLFPPSESSTANLPHLPSRTPFRNSNRNTDTPKANPSLAPGAYMCLRLNRNSQDLSLGPCTSHQSLRKSRTNHKHPVSSTRALLRGCPGRPSRLPRRSQLGPRETIPTAQVPRLNSSARTSNLRQESYQSRLVEQSRFTSVCIIAFYKHLNMNKEILIYLGTHSQHHMYFVILCRLGNSYKLLGSDLKWWISSPIFTKKLSFTILYVYRQEQRMFNMAFSRRSDGDHQNVLFSSQKLSFKFDIFNLTF